jgi:TPP-dependent pyruvate/acetoin dehydrogenase alpha subunit
MSERIGNPREPRPALLDRAAELNIQQVLDREGKPGGSLPEPEISKTEARMFYETMVLLRTIDERGWKLQRSGRIAFWIPMRGQEALQVGATHAMEPDDWIFRAHREMAPWLPDRQPFPQRDPGSDPGGFVHPARLRGRLGGQTEGFQNESARTVWRRCQFAQRISLGNEFCRHSPAAGGVHLCQ